MERDGVTIGGVSRDFVVHELRAEEWPELEPALERSAKMAPFFIVSLPFSRFSRTISAASSPPADPIRRRRAELELSSATDLKAPMMAFE